MTGLIQVSTDKNGLPVFRPDRASRGKRHREQYGPHTSREERPVHPDVCAELYRLHECHYCGISTTRRTQSIDHIIPLSRGGTNDRENLCHSCKTCNIGKADRTLPEEGGASLRAAGWICLGEAGGGSWHRKIRPRIDTAPLQTKIKWEAPE